jgi:hypothetical protein
MRSRLEASFTGEHCPPALSVECLNPINVFGVGRKLFPQCDDLVFQKKRLKAVSERWTKVIVHQQLQAASFFSNTIASFTSAGETS